MKEIKYFLMIVILASCTSNTIYKKPKKLIPKDTMKALLKDMYIASSARYTKNIFSQNEFNYMPLIYQKYKIDSTRFDESNIYYSSKVEVYSEMIKEVKKRLNDELEEIKGKDSLLKKDKKCEGSSELDSFPELIDENLPINLKDLKEVK